MLIGCIDDISFLIYLYNQSMYFVLQLAKAEKLKPLEVELRRLEDLSKSIVDDFEYMKAREKMMRDTNGRPTLLLVIFCFLSFDLICY
jgi:hypothetical protein